jgi:hypothetical protein
MNHLESQLTCSYCSKIFKDPIELPCGDNVCREHLSERNVVKLNKIKCNQCKQEFQVKKSSKNSLANEEMILNREFEKSSRKFSKIYHDFIRVNNEIGSDIYNHLHELSSLENELKGKNPSSNIWFKTVLDKHEKDIHEIKLKLNGMNPVKSSSKPNSPLHPRVNEELPIGPSPVSQIYDGEQLWLKIMKLCEFPLNEKWSLLYRASRDGFGSDVFHSKCDGHSNTLTILKAKQSSYIFGGFTSIDWESCPWPGKSKSDPNAFIFSLTNKANRPLKLNIDTDKNKFAIHCDSECGPIFGGRFAHDIFISKNANTTVNCSSNLGKVFKHPEFDFGKSAAHTFLAGSNPFQLDEIEVYQKPVQ